MGHSILKIAFHILSDVNDQIQLLHNILAQVKWRRRRGDTKPPQKLGWNIKRIGFYLLHFQ
jgi:hypothetical protein